MAIVGGLDVHRGQITYDHVDTVTGEVEVGRIAPANRAEFRNWLGRFDGRGEVSFATEGCTGWRFVVEELEAAGVVAHLAEPADTSTLRGRKKRAKTDRADARHIRSLLVEGRLPESWIPPAQVLETRIVSRSYVALMDQRRAWQQRIQAQLFHQGVDKQRGLLTEAGRTHLTDADLSPAGREMVEMALRIIDTLGGEADLLRRQLQSFARRQPGCRALVNELYGVGGLTAAVIWAEMGDTRRFNSSDQAVRHTGLDITVYESDGKRSPGRLARQGPPALRWALFEAALTACRESSPDHSYFLEVAERVGRKRAYLSVARKLARRVHHILRDLGDQAWQEVT